MELSRKKALSAGDKFALGLSARGDCYNPDCPEPLMTERAGHPISDFEIAHIRDELPPADPDADIGWRYWPSEDMTQDERNHFSNLLLLCKPCHKLIDKLEPRSYSVELLREWKAQNEGDRGAQLARSLGTIDQEDLEAAIADAFQDSSACALVSEQHAAVVRQHHFLDATIQGTIDQITALATEMESHRPPSMTFFVDGRPETSQPTIPQSIVTDFRRRAADLLQSAAPATTEARTELGAEVAALKTLADGTGVKPYLEWLERATASTCAALEQLDLERVHGSRAESRDAVEALAALLRGDTAPPVPDPPRPFEETGPTEAELSAAVIENFALRARAAKDHIVVARELLTEISTLGEAALASGPVGFDSDGLGTVAFWAAHFARFVADTDKVDSVNWVRNLTPFSLRLAALKQLWHQYEDRPREQKVVAEAAVAELTSESARCPHGLLPAHHSGAMCEALTMWELWSGDTDVPHRDLRRSIEAGHLCSVLAAYANMSNQGPTFYLGAGRPVANPLPTHTVIIKKAIAEAFGEDLSPADRLPCFDQSDPCRSLAREYLRIASQPNPE